MSAHAQQPNPYIAGYHSKKTFSLPEADKEAVIKTVAYHIKDFDLAVIWFPSRTHANVASSLAADYRKPTTSLGDLDKLPLELINNICLQLDIESLFRMRHVNARGQQIVNALHEYLVVVKHALNAFLALLRTRTSPKVTLEDFYRLLCTHNCTLCGNYGNLVFLLSWTRCCSSCLDRRAPGIRCVPAARVRCNLGLSKKTLERHPQLISLPGLYTTGERRHLKSLEVVPIKGVVAMFGEGNRNIGSTQNVEEMVESRLFSNTSHTIFESMACCAFPTYDPPTGQVEHGLSCAGCELFLQDFVSRVHRLWAKEARDTVYSSSGFLEHFAWCEHAQSLWNASNGGTVEPVDMPVSCTKGGFLDHDLRESMEFPSRKRKAEQTV